MGTKSLLEDSETALDTTTVRTIAERMDVLALTTDKDVTWRTLFLTLRRELAEALCP